MALPNHFINLLNKLYWQEYGKIEYNLVNIMHGKCYYVTKNACHKKILQIQLHKLLQQFVFAKYSK